MYLYTRSTCHENATGKFGNSIMVRKGCVCSESLRIKLGYFKIKIMAFCYGLSN